MTTQPTRRISAPTDFAGAANLRAGWLACVAALATLTAAPAHADLVFRFHNSSQIDTQGMVRKMDLATQHSGQVEKVDKVWLRRGQFDQVRAAGNWFGPGTLAADYTVNFEQLNTAAVPYCTWKITHKINHPANPKYPSQVEITPRLMHQAAGYKCDVGGQLAVEWSRATQGKTATLEFRLTSM